MFIPGSLLAFASGILLVVESDFYGFGDDWIVIGLALYATTFFAGLLFLGPEAGRIGELMEKGSPDAGPRTLRLIMLARLDLVLLFLLVYDMAVKPDFGDASSILWGLAGAAIAAGLIYWRYESPSRSRRSGGRPTGPLGLELHEERAAGDAVAGRDVNRFDRAGEGRVHGDLHLHRLQHDERLPSLHLFSRLDLDADHRSRHRRGDRASHRSHARPPRSTCRRPAARRGPVRAD